MQYTEIEPGYFVSNTQIKQFTELGNVVYGKINHGVMKDQKCAVKILFKNNVENEINQKREIEVIQRMNHRNIIKNYKIIETDKKIYLFKEFQDYKTLATIYSQLKGSSIGDNVTLQIAAQLIHSLAYLASQNIMNRDINLHNILLTNDATPKLFDFGLSKVEEDFAFKQSAEIGGNDFFMSPQNLQFDENCEQIDFEKNDVWALGMTLFVINEADFPWYKKIKDNDTDAFEQAINNMRDQQLKFKRTKNQQLQDIIRQMLQYDQDERPTFQKLCEIPIIQNLLEKQLAIEQQLIKKGQLFNKFKEINSQIKVSESIQEIIYNKLIKEFTIERDYVNIGTDLHGIYKELLEQQILRKKKLLNEFQLKEQIKDNLQTFLKKQVRNDTIEPQEYELIGIILQLQGIYANTQEEILNEVKRQCKVVV